MKAIYDKDLRIDGVLKVRNIEFECSESVFNSLKSEGENIQEIKPKKVEEKKPKDDKRV